MDTYGLEAMKRVNNKQMIWHLFLEAMRILKLKYYNSIVDHLNDLQRDPDSALLYSLMELRLDANNTEFNSVLNYFPTGKKTEDTNRTFRTTEDRFLCVLKETVHVPSGSGVMHNH